MLGYLKGKILLKGDDFMIVNVNDVGYKLLVSEKTLKKMSKKDTVAEFFVWPYLKRETIELYACPTRDEFEVFEVLEKMPGIGPKTALSLASVGSLKKLKRVIEQDDKDVLDQIKGMGEKRLRRLALELTGKIKSEKPKSSLLKDEALEALMSLGFSRKVAQEALVAISKKTKDTEERIKQALKILGKSR